MIQLLVSIYKGSISILFFGIIALALYIGSEGSVLESILLMSLGILSLGVSATLISINDHLASMRPRETIEQVAAIHESQLENINRIWVWAAVGATVIFAGFALVGALREQPSQERTVAPVEIIPRLTDEELSKLSNQPDENGCIPRLAAEAGSSCDS